MIYNLLKPYIFHMVLGVVMVASAGGLFYYVRHQGVLAERADNAEKQLKEQKIAVVQQTKRRNEQIKEISHARKEVDDAARHGDVPDRVRKFYVD